MKSGVVFQPKRIVLVGLGGIGSKLADELARYMSYTKGAPKELLLVDGDVYSEGNLERQSVTEADVGKHKAETWAVGISAEFRNLACSSMNGYVGPEGLKKDNVVTIDRHPLDGSIAIVAVDNHPTRNLFYTWFRAKVKDGILLSGGNDMTDGSILSLIQLGGERLVDGFVFHKEIMEPKGKNPAELSCAELAKLDGGSQVIWANQMAAATLGNEIHSIVSGEWDRLKERGEVYFDILVNSSVPRMRRVSGKEVEEKKETKRAASGARGKKPAKAVMIALDDIKVVDDRGPSKADVGDLVK